MNVLVVGSGAAGGTVARELSKNGISVTIIEKGPAIKVKNAYKEYIIQNVGTEISNTVCLGGTTLVTLGNGMKDCADDFKEFGIDLNPEFEEIERELFVSHLPDSHFGDGTKRIMESAESIGFEVEKMPKFIDPTSCKPCGKCALGCPQDAKWTSMTFIEEAEKYGARIIENTPVTDIIVSEGKVRGVKSYEEIFEADIVILAAGAIETPRLLQKIGMNAGNNLFVDTFVTVGGILENIKFNTELQMNAIIKFDNFIIGPHFTEVLVNDLNAHNARKKDVIGLMVMIKDEPSGKVTPDEIIKLNTGNDLAKLAQGSAIASSILIEAGVDPKTIVSTHARGAHLGGTASIGDLVNKNLQTEVEGLYVGDASIFPKAPGAPPVLTIIALAKRLAKHVMEMSL
ncbi:FAD dependent oxidoreductase [Methanobacterium lacus]|uniref:FAD dependent oxidoreductase n=1 Tax=Methanobacterium lacus (strain AL-21) TaxID=877455 RepID=F0T864_METLA|nr:FAD-dependent oxidoreductase [Methanobacterium lacus]ADZ09690.1 FAD dependent oxidoreductase [Methanobacterium lacus]